MPLELTLPYLGTGVQASLSPTLSPGQYVHPLGTQELETVRGYPPHLPQAATGKPLVAEMLYFARA